MADSKELQVKEKQELTTPAEQTTPGRVFTPVVDIFETDKEILLLADLPGVKTDDLNIDLREGVLTLTGDVKPVKGTDEQDLLIEFATGRYYRQFTISEIIDQEKIEANIADGVLRLTLPKVEKATPRKITVKAG
jgi:HSP20 family molecular chaperone IbpA